MQGPETFAILRIHLIHETNAIYQIHAKLSIANGLITPICCIMYTVLHAKLHLHIWLAIPVKDVTFHYQKQGPCLVEGSTILLLFLIFACIVCLCLHARSYCDVKALV